MSNIFDSLKNFFVKQVQEEKEKLEGKIDYVRAAKDYSSRLAQYVHDEIVLTKEQEAIVFAQAIEMQFLKSPHSVVYPNLDEFQVVKDEDYYIVTGYCDAQNSYGGMMRSPFQIKLLSTDSSWKYVVDTAIAAKNIRNAYMLIAIVIIMVLLLLLLY